MKATPLQCGLSVVGLVDKGATRNVRSKFIMILFTARAMSYCPVVFLTRPHLDRTCMRSGPGPRAKLPWHVPRQARDMNPPLVISSKCRHTAGQCRYKTHRWRSSVKTISMPISKKIISKNLNYATDLQNKTFCEIITFPKTPNPLPEVYCGQAYNCYALLTYLL